MSMKNPILQKKKKREPCRETELCRAHFSMRKRSSRRPFGNHPHTWTQSCIPPSGGLYSLVAAVESPSKLPSPCFLGDCSPTVHGRGILSSHECLGDEKC